jgi:hypothetical protein
MVTKSEKKGTRATKKERAKEVFEQATTQCIKRILSSCMKTKAKALCIWFSDDVEVKSETSGEKERVPARDGMVVMATGDDVLSLFEKHYESGNFDYFCGTKDLYKRIITENQSKPLNVFPMLVNRRCVDNSDVGVTNKESYSDEDIDSEEE